MSLIQNGVAVARSEGIDRAIFLAVRYLSYAIRYHSRVGRLPPPVATAVFTVTVLWVRLTVRVLRRIFPHKYTDADPYKQLYVDPSTIEYTTAEPFSKRRGWVVSGDWDRTGVPYMQRPNPKGIEQHFIDGVDWNETVLSDKYDEPRFAERVSSIEDIYAKLHEDGYKSQQQLLADAPETAWDGLNDAMHPLANEVAVDIGRNGELLWNMCGQHRLAVAKVLGIDRIPVQVFRRHTEWQQIRNDARSGNDLPADIRSHPDLQDVVDSG